MNLSPKKQQGMTLISMACVAVVVISMFLLALNVVPIYMEHGKVKGALDSLKHNDEAHNESPEQLMLRLIKLMGVNNVDNVTKDNISINKLDTGGTQIHVQYEVIKKVVGNASVLVEFDDTIEIN
jgi:hypothetical protein